ncbi:unnamed protein product, partial [Staurois parvus]
MTRDCRPLGREGKRVPEFDRRHRTIHKVQSFLRMRSGHPAVTDAGARRSQRGKTTALDQGTGEFLPQRTAGWPARYSDMVAAEIPDQPLYIHSIRRTDIFPPFWGGKK